MNQWTENIECILPLLSYWNSDICSRRETCVHQDKCQIGGALQVVLEIPYRFPKAILTVIDMQAKIYQYLDYIGRKDEDRTNGFTKDQYSAMLNHYGAKEGQSGKALSIKEGGLLYHVYQSKEPKLVDFNKSPDEEIKKHFGNEIAYAIPIPWGGDVVPVLIVFLKNDDQVIHLQNFIRERLREIQVIVKDTRKESLGKLVSAIPAGSRPEEDFRGQFSRWLLGWLEERDGLWLGNKLWFVVDHGLVHAKNLWKLANDLAKEDNLGDKLCKLHKTSPLIFSLAIWLHDIGYKGIHLPMWDMKLMDTRLDHIIDAHSIISAALILEKREDYNLNMFDEKILAYSGLVCAYHQKNCPINIKEMESTVQENAYEIPVDLQLHLTDNGAAKMINKSNANIKNNDRGRNKYLNLENLTFRDDFNGKALIVMASLLRFLDSCDFNRNRVGSAAMIKLRESVCKNNALPFEETFKIDLKECLEMATQEIKNNRDKIKDFGKYVSTLQDLESTKSIPTKMDDKNLETFRSLKGLFSNEEKQEKFTKILDLGRYVGLLNQQVHYYKVHNTVISASFKKKKKEDKYVDLEYEIDNTTPSSDNMILSNNDVEKEIKKFIRKKTEVIYEEVLSKDILKIENVKFNEKNGKFCDWIKM